MRKYVYRKHLREPGRFFMYAALAGLLVYISIGVMIAIKGDKINGGEFLIVYSLIGVGLALMLTIEMAIIYALYYRKFKKVEISLDEDSLIYTNHKGTIVIPYKEITSIKQPSVKYMGGWIKIGYKVGNVRLTVVLEGIGEFVRELKEKLDEKELSEKYNEKRLFGFYKTAQLADNSWDNLYRNIKWIILVLIGEYIFTLILGLITGSLEVAIFQILIWFNLVMIGFVISDIIIGRKCAKGIKVEEFNILKMDSEVSTKNLKLFTLIFSGIGIGINLIITIVSLMA